MKTLSVTPKQKFLKPKEMRTLIASFIADSKKENEEDCSEWGKMDLVFPQESWDKFFQIMKSNTVFKQAQSRRLIHVINIKDTSEGDNFNSVTLAMGFMEFTQKIFFYDNVLSLAA